MFKETRILNHPIDTDAQTLLGFVGPIATNQTSKKMNDTQQQIITLRIISTVKKLRITTFKLCF
jgi:hypothetical protein